MTRLPLHWIGALWLLVLACEPAAPPPVMTPFEMTAADLQVADIPAEAVAGELRGEAFTAVQARFRAEGFPGRDRIDLWISETEFPRQCGVPLAHSAGRRVWVRFDGVTRVDEGEIRVEPNGDGPVSVHYDHLEGPRWKGHGGGAAVLLMDEVRTSSIEGRISVCFDDGFASCVKGAFVAERCRSDLDGDAQGGTTGVGATPAVAPAGGDAP